MSSLKNFQHLSLVVEEPCSQDVFFKQGLEKLVKDKGRNKKG